MPSVQSPLTDSVLKAWYDKGAFASINGQQIFYVDDGDASLPVILLVHGFPTSSWDWAPCWQQLCENYRVVAMDMLGFGFSDKPTPHTYSIKEQADFVEGVIEHLGLTQYHVMAHDYGDTVAQELLARQNENMGKGKWLSGCFLNGGLFPETHQALLMQKLLLSPIGPLLNKLARKGSFDKNFSRVFGENTKLQAAELERFWMLINHNDGKHLFHNLITYINCRINNRQRWIDALKDSAVPLALINGSVDPVSGAHMVVRYKELECRLDYLAELPTIGHYPQVEAPTAVAEHYLRFLGSV